MRDESAPLARFPVGTGTLVGEVKLRIPGMFVAGVLALSAPVAAYAAPLGSNLGPVKAAPATRIVKAWGGCGWGWRPVPGYWNPWRGEWIPPHCAPDHYGAWGPYIGWGGPYGGISGSAPYGYWQGPYGGWVYWANP